MSFKVLNGDSAIKQSCQHQTEGPDKIEQSNIAFTWERDGSVKIHLDKTAQHYVEPISVPSILKRAAERFPDKTAITTERDGTWVKWSYQQYLEEVRTCAKAFIELGLEELGVVCILGFNAPEWFISGFAAIFARGIVAGIYTTSNPEACFYCLNHSKANILVLEDDKQLQKILPYKNKLPHLKTIIQYIGTPTEKNVLSWSRLIEIGKQASDIILENRLRNARVNQCCSLVYTSGTTGLPKAVMLSHDNVSYAAQVCMDKLNMIEYGDMSIVSFLPLSHATAQLNDIYLTALAMGTAYIADKNALKGTLINTIKYARPKSFIAVPRVWEKFYERMQDSLVQATWLKRSIFNWARSIGWEYHLRKSEGNNTPPWGFTLANHLVFSKIKDAIGMDKALVCATGGAPLSLEMLHFFASIDMPLLEVYGMSESSGPHFTNYPRRTPVLGTSGKCLPGLKGKLRNIDEEGQGEICMWGRTVFMGYLDNEEETKSSTDSEGWLFSGDIGCMKGEHLQVTGRIKGTSAFYLLNVSLLEIDKEEILITSGGENIPAPLIEITVKEELPCINHAILIGDKRKFLSILLTWKTEINPENGQPLDNLAPQALAFVHEHGSNAKTITEVLEENNQDVMKGIQAGIERANARAISHAQWIQKWIFLPKDLSFLEEELSPTLKIRRHVIYKKYANVIEEFYN